MLKVLIRKQYMELFKGYFVNRKTGKARSGRSTAMLFALFALIMLVCSGMFFGLAFMLIGPMHSVGMDWLYFALMGTVSLGLGVFGSVFNTFSALYLARDNELLISMPIPAGTILMSRLSGVFGLSLLYSGCVWLPALICYWINVTPTLLSVIFGVLLTVVIALLVLVLTCILGWVVALVSRRLKNKSIVTVLISLVAFAAYYVVCFQMSDFIMTLAANAAAMAGTYRTWLNLLYQLGMAACGSTGNMLLFTGITLVLTAVCYLVMSRSFIRLATGIKGSGSTAVKKMPTRARGLHAALYMREMKRFTSSATYMLNTGMGMFILAVISIFAFFKANAEPAVFHQALDMLSAGAPELRPMLPLAIPAVVCFTMATNCISTPSISLEGKNLWLLKSMPVRAEDVLRAKVMLHVTVNVPVIILSCVLLCVVLTTGWLQGLLILIICALFISITGMSGLILGLKWPNLHWTSEQVVIKQSMNLLFSMLIGIALVALMLLGGWFLRHALTLNLWMACFILIEAVAFLMLRHWLKTSGVRCFEAL